MRSTLVALLLAPSLLLGAEATPSAEAKVGTGIESKDVTGAAAEFKLPPDTKIYLWTKVSGIPMGGKVTLAFVRGEKTAYERELAVSGSPYRLHVYRTFRAGDSGEWTAKVLGPGGQELAAAKFQVEIQK
jgi:hypothetical protein